MPGILKRRSTPPLLAVVALAVLVVVFVLLNGGGSRGATDAGLAGYAPADSVVYVETDLRPDGLVAAEVDEVARSLTGSSVSATLQKAFGRHGESGIDYGEDVEPWLAGPVAFAAGESRAEAGLVVEAVDPEAAGAFARELSRSGHLPGDARAEVAGDALLVASSQAWLTRMNEAVAGESLDDTPLFENSMADLPEGGVASLFVSNEQLLESLGSANSAISPLLDALGIEPEGTATAMTMEVDRGGISIKGSSGLAAGIEAAGAGDLIGGFPADSVLAAGSTGVGETLGALIASADQAGLVPNDPPDGESGATGAGGLFGQASAFGVDLQSLAESLESAGVFITDNGADGLRGAIVATTSDPELVGETIRSLAALGAFAGPDLLRPLPQGLDGFSIALPGMKGSRVAVATEGERVVIALGVEAAEQALNPGDRTLADTGRYREAASKLAVGEMSLFAAPSALVPALGSKLGERGLPWRGQAEAVKPMKRLLSAVQTVAAGTGEDGSFELDLDLKD